MDLIRLVAKMDTEADERIAELRAEATTQIDCKAGCSHCCHRIVVASVSEAARIADHVQSAFDKTAQNSLKEACVRYADDSLPFRDGRLLQARPTCPFLVDTLCTIYEQRPMACRGWNSYSAAACLARRKDTAAPAPTGDARQVALAQEELTSHQRILANAGLPYCLVDLGLAIPDLLQNPKASLLECAVMNPGPDPILEDRKRKGEAPREASGFLAPNAPAGHPAFEFLRLTTPSGFSSQEHVDQSLERYSKLVGRLDVSRMDPMEAFDGLSQFQTFSLPYTGEDVTSTLKAVGETIIAPVVARAFPDLTAPKEPNKAVGKLKVGYLSNNISIHNSAFATLGWIQNHAEDIESYVFHVGAGQDHGTLKFRRAADHFYHLPGDIPATARFIRSLNLDVLIFPSIGNFGINFQYAAMRLAPVQCTHWGQPATSGLPTVDYYLSSALMEPENGDDHYTEKLVRLPGSGIYWLPPEVEPSDKTAAQLGLPDGPFYLVPQNLRKLTPKWDFLFAEIQARTSLPIVLLNFGIDTATDPTRRRLTALGLDTIWLPMQPQRDFLRMLQLCTASLDPPAWNGGNTTVYSLAVHGPLVHLPGPFMRGRHSLAFMTQAGATDLIASTPEQYVEFATDFDRLREVSRAANFHGVLKDPQVPLAVDAFLRQVSGRG